MNFSWLRPQEVLNDDFAITAETRLMALKKAGKMIKRSVEESLRTSRSSVKNEDLDSKKRRATEHLLGENLASACQVLNDIKNAHNAISPLQTILEHYANLEKTLAHMLAVHESEIEALLNGDTPLCRLISDEIPAYILSKKDLEHLAKKHYGAQNLLEKEMKKLEKMEIQRRDQLEQQQITSSSLGLNGDPGSGSTTSTAGEETESIPPPETDSIMTQREKTEKLLYEKETLEKDLGIEEAKVTSQLLTLTSRENRYAKTILNLMRLKKRLYEDAYRTIEAELPNIERILLDTSQRPVFGERLADHLRSTGRTIALPIHLSVHNILNFGMKEEGLFRISPKQIKLDKYKAQLDASLDVSLDEEDSHLQAGLLKCYLRELPEPLLINMEDPSCSQDVYDAWIEAATLRFLDTKIRQFRVILGDLPKRAYENIQFLIKFLSLLSLESESTKMTSKNLAIVLGPNLLSQSPMLDQGRLDCVISIMVTLIENYSEIFPEDIDFSQYDENLDSFKESSSNSSSQINNLKPPGQHQQSESQQQLSPGMSQKRRQSFRTFRKNIMAKLSPPSNHNNGANLSPGLTHKTIPIERDHNSV